MQAEAATTRPVPRITRFRHWLGEHKGLHFDDYDAMWRWSVQDIEAYWQAVWDYFELESPTPHTRVLDARRMPGARWFEGSQLNYARQVMRHVAPAHAAGLPAIVSRNERGEHRELGWPDLWRQVSNLAVHLKAQGLQPGDRVAAYLPNVPEAMVAFMAVVSLGGVWSICAPDMGTAAVLDRFRQIEPAFLIGCDGATWAGRDLPRADVVAQLRAALPGVRHLLLLRNLGLPEADLAPLAPWTDLGETLQRDTPAAAGFEPLWLPFDHPLWIVYSSGTTGLPKPIVHGHGGSVLVGLAFKGLHNEVGRSYDADFLGERFHWYSTTGWVMWNAQMNALLDGTTICLYDGNPSGTRERPDWTTLWRFADETGVTWFGAGAAFFANCLKAGVDLATIPGLARVRALGTTGSPLAEDTQNWGTRQFEALGRPGIWWCNISGGTDFAGAFIGGNPELPMVAGQMQCRLLGCAVEAWDESGRPVVGEVGELVCTQPLPSMPLYFWGDADGSRYLSSYFDMYPGVWRHGDWLKITPEGGCIIYGRSDATINRHGHRMGTSEIYSAVEALPEVMDSLVVDLEYMGRDSWMPLFVVLREGLTLDEALRGRIRDAIRSALSPRFLPDEIVQVAEVPRTLSGKKQELPVRKLLLGQPMEKVVNRDAMANPASLDWFVAYAQQRRS